MHQRRGYGRWLSTALIIGLLGLTTGCDPTLRTSVENGIINVSTSFLGALLQALLALATEAQTSNTTGTTTGTTALLLDGVAQPVFV
jgi:hypothetical protein